MSGRDYGAVPGRGKGLRGDDRIEQVQDQVTEVTGLLHDALEKSVRRGEKLDSLEGRAENLSAEAKNFKSQSRGLAQDMWWKNKRWQILIIVIVLLVLGGIGFLIYYEVSGKKHF